MSENPLQNPSNFGTQLEYTASDPRFRTTSNGVVLLLSWRRNLEGDACLRSDSGVGARRRCPPVAHDVSFVQHIHFIFKQNLQSTTAIRRLPDSFDCDGWPDRKST